MSPSTAEFLAAPDLPMKIAAASLALRREGELREQFRDEIGPHEKGEFINGEKIMHSPARESHNRVSSLIVGILGTYVRANGVGVLRYEKALCGFSRNDYEPDIAWFGPEHIDITFHKPQRALAPGQICGIYDGEQLLGGGIFESIDYD